MEFKQLKAFSKLQKITITDAILTDDIDFLYVYFQSCTPYQLAEWVRDGDTPTYIKLYLDYCFDIFVEFQGLYYYACRSTWGDWEKEDAIKKGDFEEDDFMPKDHEDFHLSFSKVLGQYWERAAES